jgi:hypothetical protein
MVREAVLLTVPAERKTPVQERPKLEPAMAFIDAVLKADKKALRKQRHAAHRIWRRVQAEMPEVEVAESTIRHRVRERKIALGLRHRETFIPQSYVWGGEAQVDWYEAYADICGERELAYVFFMRSMASVGAFHCAFPARQPTSKPPCLRGLARSLADGFPSRSSWVSQAFGANHCFDLLGCL